MNEIADGIWHWTGSHPEWEAGDNWPEIVSSYAIDTGSVLAIFDPIDPGAELDALAAGRDVAIVLTCPWHARDHLAIAARLNASVHVPPADAKDPDPVEGTVFSAGDTLPIGVTVYPGMEPNDLMLWVPERRALVAGDTVVDLGDGLKIPTEWEAAKAPLPDLVAAMRPLLALPVDHLLPTHGEPTDSAALERALSVDLN